MISQVALGKEHKHPLIFVQAMSKVHLLVHQHGHVQAILLSVSPVVLLLLALQLQNNLAHYNLNLNNHFI